MFHSPDLSCHILSYAVRYTFLPSRPILSTLSVPFKSSLHFSIPNLASPFQHLLDTPLFLMPSLKRAIGKAKHWADVQNLLSVLPNTGLAKPYIRK